MNASIVTQRDLLDLLEEALPHVISSTYSVRGGLIEQIQTLIEAAGSEARYTSVSKGGSYTKVGTIRGAGSLKGLIGVAYRGENGQLYVREPECFAKRMVLVEGGEA